ncbi:hypothetical protein ACFL0L_00955 [Patescibacteria group bacterium]
MPNEVETPKPREQEEAEILKPKEQDTEIHKPKKKKHPFRTFLIVLVIIIVVLILGLAATGLYNVPGISAAFGFNEPKDLGVETSTQALASLKEKIPMTITGEKTDFSSGTDIFSGEIAVDTTITAEEASSWLQRHQRPDPIISQLTIRQMEGGMEISGMVNQYIKAPVYAKVMINLVDTNTIDLNIQEGKLGMFSVPDRYLVEAEELLEDKVNSLINNIPGFSIETYELHDGYSNFKGTFPENVKPSPLGWSDLLNY